MNQELLVWVDSLSSDEKTIYTISDEHGDKTTITLPKYDADILQLDIPDVHAWIQRAYNNVHMKVPEESRRKKGNLVRIIANKYVQSTIKHGEVMNFLEVYL